MAVAQAHRSRCDSASHLRTRLSGVYMLSTVDGVFRPSADKAGIDRSWMRAWPAVVVRARTGSRTGQRVRRVLNVLVAAIALILIAPVMAVIALLVKLTSPGPVLY